MRKPGLPISQGDMLLRWHQQVQTINDSVPIKHYQTTRRGESVVISYRPKEITANVKATGERLIKDYVNNCEQLFLKAGENAFRDADGYPTLPPMKTTSVEVGQRRSLSDRQARVHIRKLQKVGLVSRYKWHGSRAAFEIWIDETVFLGQNKTDFWALIGVAQLPGADTVSQTLAPQFSQAQTELSSAYKASITTHGNKKTETYKVEYVHSDKKIGTLVSTHGNKHVDTERPQQGQLTESQSTTLPVAVHGNNGAGGGRPVDNPVEKPVGAGQRLKARMMGTKKPRTQQMADLSEQEKQIYVRSFWAYAKEKLYTARRWSEQEEQHILNSIWFGVYGAFRAPLTQREWSKFNKLLYARIDRVNAYYQRHTDKWIPEPYARFIPGTGYFDSENLRGFRATEKWIEENNRLYRQSYYAQRVSNAIQNLKLHRVGKAPKKLQQKTYIEAFRFLEAQIRTYGEGPLRRYWELAASAGVDVRPT